jgi:hypothetical protein
MTKILRVLLIAALLQLVVLPPQPALAGGAFSCAISGATADTVCKAAPGAGVRFYVNSVVISNAGTAQTVRIITGTGTTCGTSTDVVVPLVNLAINDTVSMTFPTPLETSLNEDLCSDISGTTAHSVLVSGYLGP